MPWSPNTWGIPEMPIHLLVADDSALVRHAYRLIFAEDPGIVIVAEAANGREAVELAVSRHPDLVLMDLDMPEMNGLESIAEIMAIAPTRILVATEFPRFRGLDSTFEALSRGALELIRKPSIFPSAPGRQYELRKLVQSLSTVPVVPHVRNLQLQRQARHPSLSPPQWVGKPGIVVIGASTGGPSVIQRLLAALPEDFPVPIVLVQHLLDDFSEEIITWLQESSEIEVVKAEPGTRLERGRVFVGVQKPHVVVSSLGILGHCAEPPRQGLCPSVDVLFESVATAFGARAIGVLLSGMGRDGAMGLKALRRAGAMTIAQSEASCTVFGMPKAAIELEAVKKIVDAKDLAAELIQLVEGLSIAHHKV